MKRYTTEIITSLTLIAILILFIRPAKYLMPSTFTMMLPLLLMLAFLVFTSLFWKEKAKDERESDHIIKAGRVSFLVGTLLLTMGVIIQSFNHSVDPWLVYSLVGMVLAKIASRVYNEIKN